MANTMVKDEAIRSNGKEMKSSRAKHHQGVAMVGTTDHGGCHGEPVVVAIVVVAPLLSRLLDFLCGYSTPVHFGRLAALISVIKL